MLLWFFGTLLPKVLQEAHEGSTYCSPAYVFSCIRSSTMIPVYAAHLFEGCSAKTPGILNASQIVFELIQ